MHELTLVGSIIDIVKSYQEKYKFNKVNSMTLSFGELSCVNEESLKFAFEALSVEDFLKDCKLIFQKIPPKITCNSCNKESVIEDDFSKCPVCGSDDIFLSGGMDELKLVEMDVDYE